MRQERASAVCMAVCYHLRYSSILCSMPVREIQEFEGPEESQAWRTMKTLKQGQAQSPRKPSGELPGEVPKPLANR